MSRRFLPARPGPFLLAACLLLLAPVGCGGIPSVGRILGEGVRLEIDPPPGSPAFRDLHLERMRSVVVLEIAGDDVRSNMEKVAEVLVSKGYAVRDRRVTIQQLREANLLHRRSTDPEVLRKAAEIFSERAAVAGSVEMISAEPLRVLMTLHWVDLRRQRIVWKAKASYSAYVIGGQQRIDKAILGMVERALASLPRAEF